MKPTHVLVTFTGILFMSMTALLITEIVGNRQLRQMNQDLTDRFYAEREEHDAVRDSLQATQEALETNQRELVELQRRPSQSELSEFESESELRPDRNSTDIRETRVEPTQWTRPVQVRAYLGSHFVGNGWMIPSNLRTNETTGAVQFEPIIQLEPRSRAAFTQIQTNLIERDVVRSTTYNDNRGYYPAPYYVVPHARQGRKPGARHPSPKPVPGSGNGPSGSQENPFPKFVPVQPQPGGSPWASPFKPVVPAPPGNPRGPSAVSPSPPTQRGGTPSGFENQPSAVSLRSSQTTPASKTAGPVPVFREAPGSSGENDSRRLKPLR